MFFVAASALGVGCATKLETGYKPRALGSSEDVRRGFYAQRFTPEAQKAKQYEQDFGGTQMKRRPGE
jgi:hypothetical protein